MKTRQEQVREVMMQAGQGCPNHPTIPGYEVRGLRVRLIAEELIELCEATGVALILNISPASNFRTLSVLPIISFDVSIVDTYDALIDLEVVTTGCAVAFGLNTEPGWQEVHRSNMAKIFPDGTMHKNEFGKFLKPPGWTPPKLKPIIDAQCEI